jgi:hypothetical protein
VPEGGGCGLDSIEWGFRFLIQNNPPPQEVLHVCYVLYDSPKDAMPPIKAICPSCGKPQGVPLVWGDLDLLGENVRAIIGRGEMVCGGDAITIDEHGHPMSMECLACGFQWV